ncbi:hypothetical protein GQ457_06G023520 [Hibiscus cannabinus]
MVENKGLRQKKVIPPGENPNQSFPMFALVVAIFILLRLPEHCTARTIPKECTPSVCGDVPISYPFRLTTQPPKCGLKGYELDCDSNNRTILATNLGRYYVENILSPYPDVMIRVVDANLAVGGCSLLYFSTVNTLYYLRSPGISLYLVNCARPMESSIYIDASPCLVSSSDSDPPPDSYVYFVDNRTSFQDFDESCTIEALVSVMTQSISGFFTWDIYNKLLLWGFELSCYYPLSGPGGPVYAMVNVMAYAVHSYVNSYIHFLFHGPELDILTESCIFYMAAAPSTSNILKLMCLNFAFHSKGGVVLARTMLGIVCLIILVIYKWRRRHLCTDDTIEEFLERQKDLMPIRYSYREIEK